MDIFESWIVKRMISYRGLHNDLLPENSLGAIKNAMQNGYAVAVDVRALDDGTVVAFHDEKLGRLTGLDGYLSSLKQSDLSATKLLGSDECIPTLQQVLQTVDGAIPLLINVMQKGTVGTLEKNLVAILNQYRGEFAVQSTNPYSLEYFKITAPHFFRGQVAGSMKNDKSLGYFKRMALMRMRLNKHVSCPHFISYDLHDLPSPYVSKYRKRLPILGWMVRSYEDYSHCKKFCDNVIFEKYIPEL